MSLGKISFVKNIKVMQFQTVILTSENRITLITKRNVDREMWIYDAWSRSHSDMRFVRDQIDIIYSDILCRNLVRNHFPSDFQAYSAFEMQDLSPKS